MLHGFSREHALNAFGIDKAILEPRTRIKTDEGRVIDIYREPERMRDADAIFVCVGTPWVDGTMRLSDVFEVARTVGDALKDSVGERLVVLRSTVLPGTTRRFESIIRERMERSSQFVSVCYNPEFLEERNSLKDFLNPKRTIIGYDGPRPGSENAAHLLEDFWNTFLRSVQQRDLGTATHDFYITDTMTSEIMKLANNAARATLISFYNQIAMICDKLGVNSDLVATLISRDPRIATTYGTKTKLAYGGMCVPKDVAALLRFAEDLGVDSRLLRGVHEINETIKKQYGLHKFES
jgi:nucleotide sugar dehydrogenase